MDACCDQRVESGSKVSERRGRPKARPPPSPPRRSSGYVAAVPGPKHESDSAGSTLMAEDRSPALEGDARINRPNTNAICEARARTGRAHSRVANGIGICCE